MNKIKLFSGLYICDCRRRLRQLLARNSRRPGTIPGWRRQLVVNEGVVLKSQLESQLANRTSSSSGLTEQGMSDCRTRAYILREQVLERLIHGGDPDAKRADRVGIQVSDQALNDRTSPRVAARMRE